MSGTQTEQRHPPAAPAHAVRGEFLEPILFLADCMAATEPDPPPSAQAMPQRLADLCGRGAYRQQEHYRRLSEATACARLTTARARQGALVVLALVLKTDTRGGAAAQACFARLRERLGEAPLAVPTQVQEHLRLALQYLKD